MLFRVGVVVENRMIGVSAYRPLMNWLVIRVGRRLVILKYIVRLNGLALNVKLEVRLIGANWLMICARMHLLLILRMRVVLVDLNVPV